MLIKLAIDTSLGGVRNTREDKKTQQQTKGLEEAGEHEAGFSLEKACANG